MPSSLGTGRDDRTADDGAAEQALELGQAAGDALFPEVEIRQAAADWATKSVAAR